MARRSEDKVVFAAFAAGNVRVFKGLGIHVSCWYVGKTDEASELAADLDLPKNSTDSQSRFTLGFRYDFQQTQPRIMMRMASVEPVAAGQALQAPGRPTPRFASSAVEAFRSLDLRRS